MNAKKKLILFDVFVLVVMAVALGVSMLFASDIELALGLAYYIEVEDTESADSLARNADGIYISADGETANSLNVHFVDVGQGDCAIIELPDGKTMIIDGGERFTDQQTAIQKFIDNTLAPDFKYFDYAILTHPDSDHCGSLGYVLDKYPARVCYRPNVKAKSASFDDPAGELPKNKDSSSYVNAIKAMYKEIDGEPSVVYVTDPKDEAQTITGGDGDDAYTFTFYTPLSDKYTGDDWNNYSPVMILEYRGYKFAMSGDAEEKNLNEFTAKVQAAKTDGVTDKYDVFTDDYCVNVIKAGHHGSENATTLDYLNVLTTPSGAADVYCVISCGTGNTYGHPHEAAINRYKTIGLPDDNILRTDKLGDVSFTVRVDDEGNYGLFYGERHTQNPVVPDKPDTPDTPDTPDKPDTPDTPDNTGGKKLVLVYQKIGNIELKWYIVGSVAYGALVVVALIHIALVATGVVGAPRGKTGGGKGGGKRKR